jgi:hypothetical protein
MTGRPPIMRDPVEIKVRLPRDLYDRLVARTRNGAMAAFVREVLAAALNKERKVKK